MRGVQSALSARNGRWVRGAATALAVFAAYYLGARVGFALTPQTQPVSTLWPPNAILFGMLLLMPPRRWLLVVASVFPAHLAVELPAGVPLPLVLGWFVTNCLEGLIGAAAVRRVTGPAVRFDTVRGVSAFVVFGALAAPLVTSFLDAAVVRLNAFGTQPYWDVWAARSFSNVLANLAFVPVIVSFGAKAVPSLRAMSPVRLLEAAALVIGLVLVCMVVFAPASWRGEPTPAWLYVPLPFLLWAAVRFGPAGTSGCLLAVALISIWGAIHGRGPFANEAMIDAVRSLQLFLVLTSVPLLTLTAAIRERAIAEESARRNEERLHLALSAAQMGTWEWDIAEDRAAWSGASDESTGHEQQGVVETNFRGFFSTIVPDDRAAVQAAITRAIRNAEPFDTEFRIGLPEGPVRWILAKGTVVRDRAGRAVRMLGVNTDVTERKRVEAALREDAALRGNAARLRELADAMPQIVFTADAEGRVDYLNRKWYEITGVTTDAVTDVQWAALLHPSDRKRAFESWRADVNVGRPHESESRLWSAPTQSYRWHLVRALPVRDAAGRIARWYGTATDIHDRKQWEEALKDRETHLRFFRDQLEHRVAERTFELVKANALLRDEIQVRLRAEKALRESEERFGKAFRASPIAAAIVRQAELRVIEVNPRWQVVFGYSRDHAIGRTMNELGLFASSSDGSCMSELMARHGFVSELELDLRHQSGAIIRGVVAVERVEMSGEPCFIMAIRDITDRRRAEQEIALQRRELAHLGRVALLGVLSGTLAHELNQPLAAILANARAAQRLLQRDSIDTFELRAILDDIAADDLRAGAVIGRVRGLIRNEGAQPQTLSVNDVVREVVELAHSDLTHRGARVETRVAAPGPCVGADRIQLQQVLLNLILNACDAMADRPVAERSIVISTANVGDVTHILVRDRGIGIAADKLEAVFEPFVTSKPEGVGLGLAICRSIVEAHGGRMWATNNEDCGATFHVLLPVAPVVAADPTPALT